MIQFDPDLVLKRYIDQQFPYVIINLISRIAYVWEVHIAQQQSTILVILRSKAKTLPDTGLFHLLF